MNLDHIVAKAKECEDAINKKGWTLHFEIKGEARTLIVSKDGVNNILAFDGWKMYGGKFIMQSKSSLKKYGIKI